MNRKLTGLLVLLLFCALLPFAGEQEPPNAWLSYYREAMGIFNNMETTEADDRRALALFKKTIGLLSNGARNDSVLFNSYVKGATLMIGLDELQPSIAYYNAALAMDAPPQKKFEPHLYCGRSWYALGQYDSALYHYKIAESIADATPEVPLERERLFNMMGAFYYDLGNYKQAVNYFEQALQMLSRSNPGYSDLMPRYKNNIAGCLVRLNDFDRANTICNETLEEIRNQNNPLEKIIWHRKASINLYLGSAREALHYLRRVSPYGDRNQVKLLNDYAHVFYNLGLYDSASHYIRQSLTLNKQYYPSGKNPDLAFIFKIQGDVLYAQGRPEQALREYQRSVLALSSGFTDTSIYSNPVSFSGVFAANTLLESLIAKATVFEESYQQQKQLQQLQAAVNTYTSVFALAGYMQQRYDTDEARLFLNKKKYAIHDSPIRLCVQLYRLTGNREYLDKAFYFDEQNKSAVLNENLSLLESKKTAGVPGQLLAEEKKLKQKVTALLLKLAQPAPDSTITQIQQQVRDDEIALNKLYEKMNTYPVYAQMNETEAAVQPGQLQQKLGAQTIILSYHLGEKEITGFWLKKNKRDCFTTPVTDSFYQVLQQHITICRTPGSGSSSETAAILYQALLQPVDAELEGVTELVIIPDDELHQLPFESLENKKGEPVGTLYSCTYNYSSNLLFRKQKQQRPDASSTLALAPFANDSAAQFHRLPFSGAEINSLQGRLLLNQDAGKHAFLHWLPQYRVVHLATHASAGLEQNSSAFIVFNRAGKDSAEQFLYSNEIANLDMDSVQLVYLSACETGYGTLVKGEGMMSLSRAFAYAGCSDIVTSLWQADDAATAAITRRFYTYYYQGISPAEALHRAKKDYLNDPAVEKRKKTPFYWAHLVFVGRQPGADNHTIHWWIPIAAIGTLLLVIAHGWFRGRKKE
ncbi:MAG: CHAT domain-containing protein [Dinghuibacter sp.]|nr:CHAT domain-containing protein [Dinghuibacter sp.]